MNSSGMLSVLMQSLSINDSFTTGMQKIVALIKKTEESFEAPDVLKCILSGGNDPKKSEYILFSFLDICRADFDILEKALHLRQLRRFINRADSFPATLNQHEQSIVNAVHEKTAISTVDQVVAASHKAASVALTLSQHGDVSTDDRTFLSELLMFEATILQVRSEWLSDHVDSYDMKAIARLLPLLTVCDERRSVLVDLAGRIKRHETVGRTVLTFENAMRCDTFAKWRKKINREETLSPFIELLEQQQSRLIPVRSLVAVATLSRRLQPGTAKPFAWIHHALTCCTADGFKMDIGPHGDTFKRLLAACNIVPSGTLISGSFSSDSLLSLIGTDMLTRTVEDNEREPSPKELVMRCMTNDALLLRLLENPKVAGTPGIVAQIASTSRSLAVLQKIAQTKELYSGHANNGVPLALLKNPTHIPLVQIRQFINNRYVSLVEMKEILHNPYGIRRDVFMEIKAFIEQRYK